MSVHVRIPVMASLCLLLAVVVAAAGTLTVEGPGGVSLAIMSELPMTDAGPQPALRGEVAIAPVTERLDGCPLMLYVDDRPLALAGEGATEFSLDTTRLEDGRHTVRVDALRGEQLIASTGSIPVQVLNSVAPPAVQQVGDLGGERPSFNKLYRARIFHEIIYFNNREADLEKHAFIRNGRVYITLTDLLRHIGGTIIWGPDDDRIEVQRNDVTVRLFPHSSTVYVDDVKTSLGWSTVRKQNRTYVPVRPFCELFGIVTEWDFDKDRAYVTYSG
ncbi:MAG: copper amine oxidase N-terminal domain-containing protein [Armatimonadetes bacterium]|nr:copper amine oxidase N-terminal domain-containing protein [Armatimonadota bacterium]